MCSEFQVATIQIQTLREGRSQAGDTCSSTSCLLAVPAPEPRYNPKFSFNRGHGPGVFRDQESAWLPSLTEDAPITAYLQKIVVRASVRSCPHHSCLCHPICVHLGRHISMLDRATCLVCV